MDLNKIFIKDACPTKCGGQAVLEGIMMKGPERSSVCVRLPDDSLYIKTEENKKPSRVAKLPFIRGVFVFVASLVQGMKTLMFSADVLEGYEGRITLENVMLSSTKKRPCIRLAENVKMNLRLMGLNRI